MFVRVYLKWQQRRRFAVAGEMRPVTHAQGELNGHRLDIADGSRMGRQRADRSWWRAWDMRDTDQYFPSLWFG